MGVDKHLGDARLSKSNSVDLYRPPALRNQSQSHQQHQSMKYSPPIATHVREAANVVVDGGSGDGGSSITSKSNHQNISSLTPPPLQSYQQTTKVQSPPTTSKSVSMDTTTATSSSATTTTAAATNNLACNDNANTGPITTQRQNAEIEAVEGVPTAAVAAATTTTTTVTRRERRPDRAVYIPRARRSQTTPPTTPAAAATTIAPLAAQASAAAPTTTTTTHLPTNSTAVVAATTTTTAAITSGAAANNNANAVKAETAIEAATVSGTPSCKADGQHKSDTTTTTTMPAKSKTKSSSSSTNASNNGSTTNNRERKERKSRSNAASSKATTTADKSENPAVSVVDPSNRSKATDLSNHSVATTTTVQTQNNTPNCDISGDQQQYNNNTNTNKHLHITIETETENMKNTSSTKVAMQSPRTLGGGGDDGDVTTDTKNISILRIEDVIGGNGKANGHEAAAKCDVDEQELKRASKEINRSNRRIMKQTFVSDVLEIPDNILHDSANVVIEKKPPKQVKCSMDNSATEGEDDDDDADEDDWETMFDESGECLNPKIMQELTASVGKVKIELPKMDYSAYLTKQSILNEEEFPHVLEVSGFPVEFKNQDLLMVFSQYKESGFDIKWVDDTHALAVFSSSRIAAEVLTMGHPFVVLKPLAEATVESRLKAKKCAASLQPYRPRPETCAALARRLVTGALGVKLKTAAAERENEKRVLREAKERKLLAAKQRDEAWDS